MQEVQTIFFFFILIVAVMMIVIVVLRRTSNSSLPLRKNDHASPNDLMQWNNAAMISRLSDDAQNQANQSATDTSSFNANCDTASVSNFSSCDTGGNSASSVSSDNGSN